MTTIGFLIRSISAIKKPKNHNPFTLFHNLASNSPPEDNKAPMTVTRCARFAVTA